MMTALKLDNLLTSINLQYRTISMKTTHHLHKREIIISDNFSLVSGTDAVLI